MRGALRSLVAVARRHFTSALGVTLILTVPLGALAATVSVPSNTAVTLGSTVDVSISIDDATGLEGADLSLTYDPAVVSVAGDAVVTGLTSDCMPLSNSGTAGTLLVGLACGTALNGGGALVTVPLLGQSAGVSALTFTRCDLNEGAIACTPVNGSVTVQTPTPTTTRTPTATSTRTATSTVTRTVTATPTRTLTRTPTFTRTPANTHTPTQPPMVTLDPLAAAIVVGQSVTLTGSGFTAGSRIVLFVAAGGVQSFGPYQPSSWTPTTLVWAVSTSIPLGNGFGTVVVVNTDQGFIQSNPQSQYLFGAAALNIPTIRSINGVQLRPFDPTVPVASVETAVSPGSPVTIGGTGFNSPLVNLFTASGPLGPLTPQPGGSTTLLQVVVPGGAPTGPGTFQVVNSPFNGNVVSNAVSVALGAQLTISGVSKSGSTITVTGSGFSTASVINFFNQRPSGVVNLGGYNAQGQPNIPLNIASSSQFTFTVPAGAVSGPAYVQVINPPYVPFSSTGGDPDGAFNL